MNHDELSCLIERIKTDPSVLFLGQNYLNSMSGRNPFYEAINQNICKGKMPLTPNYYDIWEFANGGERLTNENFAEFQKIVSEIPTQWWLRKILSMRWGMVFTSSVDNCLAHCVGPDFTLTSIGYDVSRFKREYMSKRLLHGVYLYGSIDGNNGEFPPELCDTRTLRSLKKRVSDRISWIYDYILRDFGIFIIDGWIPEQDWLTFLLDNASDMPYASIYIFGVTPQMAQDETIRGLVEDGIAKIEKQTFAQALSEYGFFDDLEENETWWFGVSPNEEVGKTVTIRSEQGQDTYLNIPLSALDALDNHIILLHDDLGYMDHPDRASTSDYFARFLQQGNTPVWSLYSPQMRFYFKRRIDETLWKAVNSQLKRSDSYHRSTIILEGVSNSGKTASLVNLAMRFRALHKYPVIYIGGIPSQSAFTENLKKFIKRYLLNRQDSNGAWVNSVIVFWDGNTDASAVQRYEKLAQDLIECNALVIGTAYSHANSELRASKAKSGITKIPISAELYPEEKTALEEVLKLVDEDLYERYQEIVFRAKSEPNLLHVLQQLSKYSYSPEWKSVAAALKMHFDQEVERSETETRLAAEKFEREISMEEVEEAIARKGFAAAWQLQLENLLEKMKVEGGDTKDSGGIGGKGNDVADDKYRELLGLQDDIRLLNETLAVAGQFSVSLPVTLLLNMIHQDNGMPNRVNLFLNDVLANDSLIEYNKDDQGYPMVKFRHPSEAELYVNKNFESDPQILKQREVDLLCGIIRACRWGEDESYDVISLIRCFGPNSFGKYSENVQRGNYCDYRDFWPQIANNLIKHAEGNPEAVLVYAHLMREKFTSDQDYGVPGSEDYLSLAARELRQALENHDQHNKAQYNRLIVEVCSNLVASMPRNRNKGIFDRDIFREMQNHFDNAISSWMYQDTYNYFTTNSLLDIWLNAVQNFHNSFADHIKAVEDREFVKCLSDSVSYIDILFDMEDDFDSMNLLDKIDNIYSWTASDAMKGISQRLASGDNDTFLYLSARRCWLTNAPRPSSRSEMAEIIRYNLFFLPDMADRMVGLRPHLTDLKAMASAAAERAIAILSDNMDLIYRSRSSRCLYMLIRAKWLLYTGNILLEEHQQPVLTREQWSELDELCNRYILFCAGTQMSIQPAGLLIRSVYLWSFTNNIGESRSLFSRLRQVMGNVWLIERIGLCVAGSAKLRQFNVDVRRSANGRYEATICKEITTGSTPGSVSLVGRFGIHISDWMLSYLFDGQEPRERYGIQKPVVLWFNASGPSLGVPTVEKAGDQV